jgi:cysteine desulfurase family protein (TIGR01976 family)
MPPAPELDVDFCRTECPALTDGWALMENAGGTLVPQAVVARVRDFMTRCQVQPGAPFPASAEATARIDEGRAVLAALINAEVGEIVVGPSTTSNVYVLSHALRPLLRPGDEIIVTNQDHEANNGAWRRLAEHGLVVREWAMNADTDDLELDDLAALLTDRTRLVCFTHCSNIVGLVHDVKAAVRLIHEAGAWACVDGVALVPHRRVDVKDLDVDFYLYSAYKVFGPHVSVLYGKPDLLRRARNQNHFFIPDEDAQRKLCPGGLNYELTAAAAGIGDYLTQVHERHWPGSNADARTRLDRVFALFARHETRVAAPVIDRLRNRPEVRLVGAGAPPGRDRVGVLSFVVEGRPSRAVSDALLSHRLATRSDDFYAARCIDALGVRSLGGVVRASLVHYNTEGEAARLIEGLDAVL